MVVEWIFIKFKNSGFGRNGKAREMRFYFFLPSIYLRRLNVVKKYLILFKTFFKYAVRADDCGNRELTPNDGFPDSKNLLKMKK